MVDKLKLSSLVAATALTVGLTGAAQAATIVFQDNFNTEILETNATLDNWTVTRDSVDVIGNPAFFDFYPGNGRYLDMNGSTAGSGQTEGRIETGPLGLILGKIYTLTFDYGTNSNPGLLPAILTMGLGTDLATLTINAIPAALINVSYTFTYDGSGDYLSFADASGTPGEQGGPVIDNVVLSAVPVPAAGFLLVGALGGLAALRRRKALAA